VKLVIVSDTHGRHRNLTLPQGDILIHCGDFLGGPLREQGIELLDFDTWIGDQRFKHKIVIAGNHDKVLGLSDHASTWRPKLTNCIYLQDESVKIGGMNFYGSPWTPDFFPDHWVFNQTRGTKQTRERWAQIPDNTDVLITHGPPAGILDTCPNIFAPHEPVHVGCEDLRTRISQLKNLRLHVFGHIHEAVGTHYENDVHSINAASLDGRYELRKPGYTVFEL
jgi:Icc-related predicted phosphoesterase